MVCENVGLVERHTGKGDVEAPSLLPSCNVRTKLLKPLSMTLGKLLRHRYWVLATRAGLCW